MIFSEIMLNEKQKAEEAEQEQRAKLLRSRNKKEEDPEREKKKKDAKMKQQAIQEREQLKQADETALIASQRKRPTTSVVSIIVNRVNFFFQTNDVFSSCNLYLGIVVFTWWIIFSRYSSDSS